MNEPISRRTALGVMLSPLVLGCTDAFAPALRRRSSFDATTDPILLIGAGDPHSHFTNLSFKIGQLLKAEFAANPSAYMFCAGDLVPHGRPGEFGAYNAAYGLFGGVGRFFSVIGNHDRIYDPTGKPYYDYVGQCGGPAGRGYYAVTLGSWRLYFLNSEQWRSAQTAWLQQDLPLYRDYNIMAMWHTPMFDSICRHSLKPMTNGGVARPWWDLLYQYGAELVINGHVHRYERYLKQAPDATVSETGIRQFLVGTGGVDNMDILTGGTNVNSAIQLITHGYFKLWLYPDRYEWQFVDLTGVVQDSGTQAVRKVTA